MKRILSALLVVILSGAPARAVEFTREQAGRIAKSVGDLLDRAHYKGSPMNDAVAEMHLKNYLDALDFNHMIFLQTDVDEFTAKFGKDLDNLTKKGDAGAAYEIYERYLQRLDATVNRVGALVKQKHDFTVDEKFIPQRNKLPWPKDAAEAQELWRQRMKFELLGGKLAGDTLETTAERINKRYARLQKHAAARFE